MLRRVLALCALAGALAVVVVGAGCSAKKVFRPNLPPETLLFLRGPIDTVNHVAHLYWFGSDPDGSVVGYELRLLNPAAPTDTAWNFTTVTDSIFTVYTPAGVTRPVLEVRAIDDAGARDPDPARETFTFTNQAPSVTFTNRLRTVDTTYASATLTWSATDPDGDAARTRFAIWLNGREASPDTVTGATYTVPSSRFLELGVLRSGFRQAFIQPIDDGGRVGAADSVRWYVRAPGDGSHTGRYARLLLIDDVPNPPNPTSFSTDTLYANTAARRGILPSEMSILRFQFTQPFRSPDDLRQTFELFDAVVWYRGTEVGFSTVMSNNLDGVSAYVRNGGRLLLEGLYLLAGQNTKGPLTEDFAREHLGITYLHRNFDTGLQDSTAGWGNFNGNTFRSTLLRDSVRLAQLPTEGSSRPGGIRAFSVEDTSRVVFWAPPGQLSPSNAGRQLAVATAGPSSGPLRFVLLTFPLRGAIFPGGFGNTHVLLGEIFALIGL